MSQWYSRLPRSRRAIVISGAAVMSASAAALAGSMYFASGKVGGARSAQEDQSLRVKLPPPDLLRPISPEEAMKANAERAFSVRPDLPASAFTLRTDQASSVRALECLAQAVYYEAATESAEGQRAVAQVVLNRVRHPGYPSSVCGVVYQGSERVTGCQFSFTCDGSLARIPAAWRWKQALSLAQEALSGRVFAPVGHATHYHADYVLPYWADSLDKATQIGRHIFYRFKGSAGSRAAFSQRYKGAEPMPPAPASNILPVEAADENLMISVAPPTAGLEVIAGELMAGPASPGSILADTAAGTLLRDEGGSPRPTQPARRANRPACPDDIESTPLKPMSTSEMRAAKPSSC